MPVVARLNSVVCACKSKQCRVDAVDACVFDTATLASSSVFTPLAKLPQTSPHLANTHFPNRIQPSRTTQPETRVGAAGAALRRSRARHGAPGAVEASRVQAHAGPRRPRLLAPGAATGAPDPIHLAAQTPRAARAKGCHRADADKGQPHAAAAREAASRGPPPRKRWRPPSSRSARRRRRVLASSRSAFEATRRRRSSSASDGARPSRPAARI